MKKFINHLLFFTLLFFIIASLFDYAISMGLRKTKENRPELWNAIFSGKISSDVIIMGNSRAYVQYNPQILERQTGLDFYNLGIDGHPFNYQLICYNTFRRFNKKPKYIIQNIDYATFDSIKGDANQFLPYVFDDSLMHSVSKTHNFTFSKRRIPLLRYFGDMKSISTGLITFFSKERISTTYKGFAARDKSWEGLQIKKINIIHYSKNQNIIKQFEKYLMKCKEENIKIILVSAPLYYKASQKIQNISDMKFMFASIAHKYDLPLIDYTNDSICNDTANFFNASHLNLKGATLFSLKLGKDFKKLLGK